jgi:hypothetical protein
MAGARGPASRVALVAGFGGLAAALAMVAPFAWLPQPPESVRPSQPAWALPALAVPPARPQLPPPSGGAAAPASAVPAAPAPEAAPAAAPRAPGPPRAHLRLVSTPPAEVDLDGRALGTTPVGPIELADGLHHVHLRGPDGTTIRRRVILRPGEEKRLHFDLPAERRDR